MKKHLVNEKICFKDLDWKLKTVVVLASLLILWNGLVFFSTLLYLGLS